MATAQKLAQNLRQIIVLFWVLGGLATLGIGAGLVSAVSAENVDGAAVLVLVVQLLAIWIGLGWMGLVAGGLAELLAARRE